MKIQYRPTLTPTKQLTAKQAVQIFVILAFIIGAMFVVGVKTRKERQNGAPENQTAKIDIGSKNIIKAAEGKVPDYLPANLPLSGRDGITESYDAYYENSKRIKESVVTFKSVNEAVYNYNFYIDWFSKNNWRIINKAENFKNGGVSFLYANPSQNENKNLNITIVKNSDKTSNINISYLEF